MIAVGIDLGLDGAVAVIREGDVIALWDTPTTASGPSRVYDAERMVQICRDIAVTANGERVVWAVERDLAIQRKGGWDTGTTALKTSARYWLWAIHEADKKAKPLRPAPQTWQAAIRARSILSTIPLPKRGAAIKEKVRTYCLLRWPAMADRLTRYDHSDAIGIAAYAEGEAKARGWI